jgi:hypothetical protein
VAKSFTNKDGAYTLNAEYIVVEFIRVTTIQYFMDIMHHLRLKYQQFSLISLISVLSSQLMEKSSASLQHKVILPFPFLPQNQFIFHPMLLQSHLQLPFFTPISQVILSVFVLIEEIEVLLVKILYFFDQQFISRLSFQFTQLQACLFLLNFFD